MHDKPVHHAAGTPRHLEHRPFGMLPPEIGARLVALAEMHPFDGPLLVGGMLIAWIPDDDDQASGEQVGAWAEDPGMLLAKLEQRIRPPRPRRSPG